MIKFQLEYLARKLFGANIRKKPGFDHWLALLIAGAVAVLIATAAWPALKTLITTLIASTQTAINQFFPKSIIAP